eukprot:jgi/Psemu1/313655/fgenesh1_kg.1268_\
MTGEQETIIDEEWNNIVAQSEYNAALVAIKSSFDTFQSWCLQQHNDENVHHSLDQEMIEEIYKAAKESLLKNIKRVVRPIDDDHYSDYVDQYHVVLDDEDSEDDGNESFYQRQALDNAQNQGDDEEDEIDEEELVDKKAWKDAQELRKRIRVMAGTVQGVRERVLKCTEEGIASSFSENLVDTPIRVRFDGEEDINNKDDDQTSDASNDEEHFARCNTRTDDSDPSSLQNSLKDLAKLLQDSRWKRLPTGIKSLQETMETIEKETSEDRVMSQTEIAITTRCKDTIDDCTRQKLFGEHPQQDGLSSANNYTMNPMDRLALFGQTFS